MMTTHRLAALCPSLRVALRALCTVVAGASAIACADPGEETGSVRDTTGGNLGVAGASCLRTPDCVSPLQCITNVCRAVGASDGTDSSGATDTTDATASDTGYDYDSETRFDGTVPDIVEDYDASEWEFLADTAPDTTPDSHIDAELFEGCGALGVSENWAGPFEGLIEFHVTDNPLTPSDGFLPVEGRLAFDIECIESKFVVKGTMDGTATIEGQAGSFPFVMKIQGYYSPLNKQMQAKMIEGSVNIYGLVEVYFAGDFLGELKEDGEFDGTWEGESTGTNQTFITGTAEGAGIWGAAPL